MYGFILPAGSSEWWVLVWMMGFIQAHLCVVPYVVSEPGRNGGSVPRVQVHPPKTDTGTATTFRGIPLRRFSARSLQALQNDTGSALDHGDKLRIYSRMYSLRVTNYGIETITTSDTHWQTRNSGAEIAPMSVAPSQQRLQYSSFLRVNRMEQDQDERLRTKFAYYHTPIEQEATIKGPKVA